MALHVALIQPQIPPNTGNIARLCAATDTPLHLIGPLGFSLDAREVKRAGLDYWDKVDLWVHPDWYAFRDAISRDRCLYFSANATRDYLAAPYRANSCLVFGSETDGMPSRILEKHPERCFRIPMPGEVRSLNLANAVSVVLYDGLRRTGSPAAAAVPPSPADRSSPASPAEGGSLPR
jgi:tRNA (cytidine/uridine-2'-O-)-methyltransferase